MDALRVADLADAVVDVLARAASQKEEEQEKVAAGENHRQIVERHSACGRRAQLFCVARIIAKHARAGTRLRPVHGLPPSPPIPASDRKAKRPRVHTTSLRK